MTSSIADPVRMVQNAKSLTYTDYYPNVGQRPEFRHLTLAPDFRPDGRLPGLIMR